MSLRAPSSNDQRRLYGDLAWTWPVISPPEDYVGEAETFCTAIREHAQVDVKTLLDLGCGGGHNDRTLKQHFEVTGVDVSEAMLSLARRLNPEVTYALGDMRTVRLGKTFDAVIVADSIDYMCLKPGS
jgi:predicted TPR repeat methyltransferase